MNASAWLALAALAVTVVTLAVSTGFWAGKHDGKDRREVKPGAKEPSEGMRLRMDTLDASVAGLRARLAKIDEMEDRLNDFLTDWHRNREEWHRRFQSLEDSRGKLYRELDSVYLRADVARALTQSAEESRAAMARELADLKAQLKELLRT